MRKYRVLVLSMICVFSLTACNVAIDNTDIEMQQELIEQSKLLEPKILDTTSEVVETDKVTKELENTALVDNNSMVTEDLNTDTVELETKSEPESEESSVGSKQDLDTDSMIKKDLTYYKENSTKLKLPRDNVKLDVVMNGINYSIYCLDKDTSCVIMSVNNNSVTIWSNENISYLLEKSDSGLVGYKYNDDSISTTTINDFDMSNVKVNKVISNENVSELECTFVMNDIVYAGTVTVDINTDIVKEVVIRDTEKVLGNIKIEYTDKLPERPENVEFGETDGETIMGILLNLLLEDTTEETTPNGFIAKIVYATVESEAKDNDIIESIGLSFKRAELVESDELNDTYTYRFVVSYENDSDLESILEKINQHSISVDIDERWVVSLVVEKSYDEIDMSFINDICEQNNIEYENKMGYADSYTYLEIEVGSELDLKNFENSLIENGYNIVKD